MSAVRAEVSEMPPAPKPRKLKILGVGLLFFVLVAIAAVILCKFRVEYVTQVILNQQRDAQQTWLDKSLDSIRVWRNQLMEQARYVSSAELFRLFVQDTKSFTPDELARLAEPDSLHSPDDSVRSMAEQLTYIQDLLKDFTLRRAWNDARILLPDGTKLIEPRFSNVLVEEQVALARAAAREGRVIFGPIRQGPKGLVIDVADPMYEVLGMDNANPVAVLLLSLPMEKPLATFLSRNVEHSQTLLPRIVYKNGDSLEAVSSSAGVARIEPVKEAIRLENIPFGPRKAIDGKGEMYSLGATLQTPDWLFLLETPAPEVAALIHDQKMQIYGLGLLGSIGIALLGAFVWAALTSKAHEARARMLEKLYTRIFNQKVMLDSINNSMEVGLVLLDANQRVQMSNSTFDQICHLKEIPPNTPIAGILPPDAVDFMYTVGKVLDSRDTAWMEITIHGQDKDDNPDARLYRVTFFPFEDAARKDQEGGCVAIFQDITAFRAAAIKRARREKTVLSLLGYIVESVDPSRMGDSDRMAELAEALSETMHFSKDDMETLKLAIRLSHVGKMFVPRELLVKGAALTPSELAEVRKAPKYADELLSKLKIEDLPVRETVGMMGERLDGSGYFGLEGEQITKLGRTLAIINAFVNMTAPRPWRLNGMGVDEVLRNLKEDHGFDQHIVATLAQIPHDKLEAIAKRKGQDESWSLVSHYISSYREAKDEQQKREDAAFSVLGMVVESIDPTRMGDSDRMAKVSNALAEKMNLSQKERETLKLAIRLSHVGKMFVPRELLNKDKSLTPEELTIVRKSPEYADRLLGKMNFYGLPVRETVRMMGERLDGSGYFGMEGEEITRAGRVLALVNAFVSMTAPRPWRPRGMAVKDVIANLKRDKGFDTEIVEQLSQIAPEDLESFIQRDAARD